jgi:hypothetical protein
VPNLTYIYAERGAEPVRRVELRLFGRRRADDDPNRPPAAAIFLGEVARQQLASRLRVGVPGIAGSRRWVRAAQLGSCHRPLCLRPLAAASFIGVTNARGGRRGLRDCERHGGVCVAPRP